MAQEALDINEKLTKFSERMKDDLSDTPVVFCLSCGSTYIDQNFTSQLQCYDCREISLWNGRKFGIARGGHPSDVRSLLTPVTEGFWDNWHAAAVEAIYEFGKGLSQVVTIGRLDGDTASKDLDPEEHSGLVNAWEQTKAKIDRLLT